MFKTQHRPVFSIVIIMIITTVPGPRARWDPNQICDVRTGSGGHDSILMSEEVFQESDPDNNNHNNNNSSNAADLSSDFLLRR